MTHKRNRTTKRRAKEISAIVGRNITPQQIDDLQDALKALQRSAARLRKLAGGKA